ncbi:MAG TPA: alpha/beta fold hydrolase [Acidimicrobiales bacterium]|nr:alpha/beta fold hydrolase [Acidimicrobiales bacterium]
MPTTSNGGISLYYETFGAEDAPVLLLVNGLGSQCINYKVGFCEKFVTRGFRVVRFDNRDVGLSTHLDEGADYTVDDMAGDGFSVLDAVGAPSAHIAGWSMGGMIVQAMALSHPERVLTMTSVMSAPGGLSGERDPDVVAAFTAPPATTREEAAERHLAGLAAWGSPACFDVERITADAYAAYDRCWDPGGRQRQAAAIARSPSREEALRSLSVPTLVIHGDADRLIPPEFGRRTAAAVPGARLEIVEGMGHDYPPPYWDRLVDLIATHASGAPSIS